MLGAAVAGINQSWKHESYIRMLPGFQSHAPFQRHALTTTTRKAASFTIYRITTLADSGSGSFREASEATGNRIVVFDVSGDIVFSTPLDITNDRIWIAGQSAPGPIVLKGPYDVEYSGSHMLTQHVSFRPGNETTPYDALWINSGSYVTFNHCTMAWASDETISISSPSGSYVTLSLCLIAECMDNVGADQSHGTLLGQTLDYCMLDRCLSVHNDQRNPNIAGDSERVVLQNWAVYNYYGAFPEGNATEFHATEGAAATTAAFYGCHYKKGADTDAHSGACDPIIIYDEAATRSSSLYLNDIRLDNTTPADPWDGSLVAETSSGNITAVKNTTDPQWIPYQKVIPADQLQSYLAKYVGMRPNDRQGNDQRVVNDYVNDTGNIIDDLTGLSYDTNTQKTRGSGGVPTLESLGYPSNPTGIAADGRCAIESWLIKLSDQFNF